MYQIERVVHIIANLLSICLSYQRDNSIFNAIQTSKSLLTCTHFDEPSYIDLHHFLTNLKNNLRYIAFKNGIEASQINSRT